MEIFSSSINDYLFHFSLNLVILDKNIILFAGPVGGLTVLEFRFILSPLCNSLLLTQKAQ
jgi:hypothetical protein